MSRVDVIVPCYKYGHYLRECVESVLDQSHRDLRVLIIDDASPDHTAEVAADLAARDPRVEFRRHAVNQGHIATYNEGLEWATGDYTLLLSADDLLVPGALLRASRLLDAHPEVGLVHGGVLRFRTGEPRPSFRTDSGECAWRIVPGHEWLGSRCREGRSCITSPEAVVRTRIQRELGGYLAELPHNADMEMWMRFATVADVGVLDADQAFHRHHANNMSLKYTKREDTQPYRVMIGDYRQRKVAFDVLFRDHGSRITDRDRLRDLANRALAWDVFWIACATLDSGDLEGCQECLDFAVELFPGLKSRPQWSRLWLKRRLGPKLWSKLRSVVNRIRGVWPDFLAGSTSRSEAKVMSKLLADWLSRQANGV